MIPLLHDFLYDRQTFLAFLFIVGALVCLGLIIYAAFRVPQ